MRMLSSVRPVGWVAAGLCLLAMPSWGALGAWTSIGPIGGSVRAMAVDPQQPDFVYVSLTFGGMFRSGDGGVTWVKLPAPFVDPSNPNTAPLDLAVDPNDSMRVLALRVNELWESLDRGFTWALLTDSGEISQWILELRYDPSNPQRLYGNTANNGIFRSDDDGATWVLAGLSDIYSPHRWTVAADGTLYACDTGTTGVYKSTNHGATWAPANSGFPSVPNEAVMAADPGDPMRVYAASNLGFFLTSNAGASWTAAGVGLPASIRQVLVDPTTPSVVYAVSGSNLYRSTDSGANFTLFAPSFAPEPSRIIAPATAPGRLLAATSDGGVWRSTDSGVTWAKTGQGMSATRISSIAIDPADPAKIVAATFGDGLYLTSDGGATWRRPSTSPFAPQRTLEYVGADPHTPQRFYVGASFIAPGFFVSTDGGETWNGVTAATGWPAGNATDLAFHPTDPTQVFAAHAFAGAFKSTDGGNTWASIWTGPPAPSPSNRFGPIELDPLAPARMYLAYRSTSGSSVGTLYRTGDGGGFWGIPAPTFRPSGGIVSLEVDPSFVGTLYAIGGGKLYRSDTLALSWVERMVGLPAGAHALSLMVDPQASANLYLATDDGVFSSSDRALTWTRLGNELAGKWVVTLAIAPSDPKQLVASVNGGGLWVLTVPSIFADGFETGDTSAWSEVVP